MLGTAAIDTELARFHEIENPHPLYRRMRAEMEPIYWSDALHGWVVTRHADVSACFASPQVISDRVDMFFAHLPDELDQDLVSDYKRIFHGMMDFQDGANHRRLRQFGARCFTGGMVGWLTRIVEERAAEIVDILRTKKEFDLVTDFAAPLAQHVVSAMFDVAEDKQEEFKRWSNDAAMMMAGDIQSKADGARAKESLHSLQAYILQLFDERQSRPTNDFLGPLLTGFHESQLTNSELISQCILFISPTIVSLNHQMCNAANALLSNVNAIEVVRRNPQLMRSALDEIVRYDGAVQFVHRLVAEDMSLGGRSIQAGDVLWLGLGPANYDPDVFPTPEEFDIDRANARKAITFGHGPHMCLGFQLAMRTLEAALRVLFCHGTPPKRDTSRRPRRMIQGVFLRGFDSLPMTFI